MEYNHVLLTILIFSIYLSFEFTMVENALLSLTQHKLNEIKKISEKTYDILIRNYNNDKIYISILTFDYFANALIAVLTSIFRFDFSNNNIYFFCNNYWRNCSKIYWKAKI